MPTSVARLIAQLDAPTWRSRDLAEQQLRVLTTAQGHEIESSLCEPTLSLEQHARLTRVGLTAFLNSPRAAMGISFEQNRRARGVAITRTLDGFESQRLLREGDVLLAIAGKDVNSLEEARALIISHEPGDLVELDLLRNAAPMKQTLRLGSFRDLRDAPAFDSGTLESAWAVRLERLCNGKGRLSEPATTIDPGLRERDLRLAVSREIDEAGLPNAEPGDETTPWSQRSEELRTLTITPAGSVRSLPATASSLFFLQDQPTGPAAEALRTQQAIIDRMVVQIRANENALRNGQVPQAQRGQLENTIAVQRTRLAQARADLRKDRKLLQPLLDP